MPGEDHLGLALMVDWPSHMLDFVDTSGRKAVLTQALNKQCWAGPPLIVGQNGSHPV